MLFNSYQFIFGYFPIVFAGFFWVARSSRRLAALWLGAASLFFYGWWNPVYVLLLLASIIFNYSLGCQVGRTRGTRQARPLLIIAIAANLSLLGYFKYANFFVSTVNNVAGSEFGSLHIVLPLGISFFTFTQIAFLVDVYRGIAREYNFIHYILFVTYFPHLIAGPVLHHKQMMPQFGTPTTYQLNWSKVTEGLTIFLIGLAKKVVLADSLGTYVEPVFSAASAGQTITLIDGWLGALCYTFQLYFDFSGYSDMAIGLSLMFGVSLPINFNSPYRSTNIIEFWRRWNMTLSQFLRDYLYIPLGGNRKGAVRRHLNLMGTMLLGGLWHGASWTFVIWGGLHGCYLIANHLWQYLHYKGQNPIHVMGRTKLFGGAVTFVAVVIAWVVFRAETLEGAWGVLAGMAGLNGVTLFKQIVSMIPFIEPYVTVTGQMATLGGGMVMGFVEQTGLVLISAFICFLLPNTQQMTENSKLLAVMLSSGFIVQAVFFSYAPSPFLYFQF